MIEGIILLVIGVYVLGVLTGIFIEDVFRFKGSGD